MSEHTVCYVSCRDFQFSREAPASSSTEIVRLARFQASLIMGVISQRSFTKDRRVAGKVVHNWQERGGHKYGVTEQVFSCITFGDFELSPGAVAPSSMEIADLSRFKAFLIMGGNLLRVI